MPTELRKTVTKRIRHSEVEAYKLILEELEKTGWNTRNPAYVDAGEVYTQGQCLSDSRIAKQLGQTRPENIVKLSEDEFYIIEAKATREQLEQALKEVKEDYANKINQSKSIKAKIISGLAGNEVDGYLIKSQFLENGKWRTIKENGQEITGLVSKNLAKVLLEKNTAEIKDVPVDEKIFLATAERINSILHEGAITKDYRARVMAALLLSLIEETPLNLNEPPRHLINSISSRVNSVLQKEGKPEFYRYLEIDLPATPDNHFKFKKALQLTIQELLSLNIRSAMNSGTDVLGKFYEVFLKYGNGAKDIGIVLTPRHITEFASEILDVNEHDIIFDPTCGTGGFLVAGFDRVKKSATIDKLNVFKQKNIFGIDQQDGIVALAIVNMIFRGDGKTNLIEGNCFNKWLNLKNINGIVTAEYLDKNIERRIPPISKVLMNPPFAQKSSDDKEYKFVEHALKQMRSEGLLFSVLPKSIMVKQGKNLTWRRDSLLRENTLISVINFPDDLFYPVGALTCGIVVKKGVPHPSKQKVLWINITEDGLLKSKGKRLPNNRTSNQLNEFRGDFFKNFIESNRISVKNQPEFLKLQAIDMSDTTLELLPEVYLDEKRPTDEGLSPFIEQTLKETIAFLIKHDKESDFRLNVLKNNIFSPVKNTKSLEWQEIGLDSLFQSPINTGDYHASSALDPGKIPLVSCSTENNGLEGYFDIPKENTHMNAITIASDGTPLTSFYHYYPFAAKDNVIVCKPKEPYKFTTMLFIATQLNRLRWRFNYGRKCYLNKIHKIKIFIPYYSDEIAENFIDKLFKQSKSWKILERLFS